jgi:hypothetical protein
MSKQKVTYITYNEGIDAKNLHLGNLVHSIKDPRSYEPYVDKTYSEFVSSLMVGFSIVDYE